MSLSIRKESVSSKNSTMSCFFCRTTEIDSLFKCDYCSSQFCSAAHLWLHRNDEECYPYKIEEREGKGRCLIAAKDLKAGSLLFKETPLVVGPLHDSEPNTCLGCFAPGCKTVIDYDAIL